MPLHRLLTLALVFAVSLSAAPLTITEGGPCVFEPVCISLTLTGPKGAEHYDLGILSDLTSIGQNDRWQVLIETESGAHHRSWHAINYGRGPGDYVFLQGDFWDGSEGNLLVRFLSAEDIPGFVPPEFFTHSGGGYNIEFLSIDNSGLIRGNAYFMEAWFDPTPDDEFNGDTTRVEPFIAPFTYNLGANPYFTPEPGSIVLVGLGLFAVWRVRRAGRSRRGQHVHRRTA